MSLLELSLYLVIDAFCVIVLIILAYNSKRQFSRMTDNRIFIEYILITIIMIVANIIWRLVNGINLPGFRLLNVLSIAVYLSITGVVGFFWAIYVDCKIEYNRKKLKLRAVGYSLFAIILIATILTSPWTKLIYFIDENNVYHRGPLYLMQVMVWYIYFISSTIIALFESKNISLKRKKKEVLNLTTFALFPIIGEIAQVINLNIPFLIVGVTLSILMIYVNLQNKQLSRDALTGIFNRWQLNRFLDAALSEKKHDKLMFFILIDIDKFKYINDTFGHLEGDNAIIRVAEILTTVCDSRSDFLARFGGDEFAIVCERNNVYDVEKLKNDINIAVEHENINGNGLYSLSLSMGSAQFFIDGNDTQDEVISLADKRLYQVKSEKSVLHN